MDDDSFKLSDNIGNIFTREAEYDSSIAKTNYYKVYR